MTEIQIAQYRLLDAIDEAVKDFAEVVIAIATAWVNMVSYLIKNTGLTHKEADSMVYDIFKNDQERFADFCKLYYN